MAHQMEDYYSDDSSVEAPPPPPPSQSIDDQHEEQLKIFRGMAEFDNSKTPNTNRRSSIDNLRTEDLDAAHDDDDDDQSVEVPPPPGLVERYDDDTKSGSYRKMATKYYAYIGVCLLVVIGVVLGVGFGTGAFTESKSEESTLENPGSPGGAPSPSQPQTAPRPSPTSPGDDTALPPAATDQARIDRLRDYLTTVSINGGQAFEDPLGAESRALTWLIEDDPLLLDPIDFESHLRLDQRFALLSLWFQSDFQWFDETNWLVSEDECSWQGVTCGTASPEKRLRRHKRQLQEGSSQVVSGLTLPSNNLQGALPLNIGLLQYLEILDLSGNFLSGPIPPSIGMLEFVRELRLNNNQLGGDLNAINFASLTNMEIIDLSQNEIQGTIPTSFYSMGSNLATVALDDNRLTGSFSTLIQNLSGLGTYWMYAPVSVSRRGTHSADMFELHIDSS